MRISVVIPTKNRPKDLINAIESIYTQDLLPDELVIIDQSASEESKKAVVAYHQEREKKFELVYVLDPQIAGLVPARKYSIPLCQGDLIVFLEDDVVLGPHFLSKMVQGFLEVPHMMGASGIMTNYSRSAINKFFYYIFYRGIFYDPRPKYHGRKEFKEKYVKSTFLNGGLTAYRREVFEQVDFDDKNDFFLLEDVEFSTRAALKFGADKFFINTSAQLEHLFAPSNRHNLRTRYARKIREAICFSKKNQRRLYASLCMGWLAVGFFCETLVTCLKTRQVAPLAGLLEGLREGLKWKVA